MLGDSHEARKYLRHVVRGKCDTAINELSFSFLFQVFYDFAGNLTLFDFRTMTTSVSTPLHMFVCYSVPSVHIPCCYSKNGQERTFLLSIHVCTSLDLPSQFLAIPVPCSFSNRCPCFTYSSSHLLPPPPPPISFTPGHFFFHLTLYTSRITRLLGSSRQQ